MTEDGAPLATRLEAVSNGAGENTLVWFPGSYADGMNWARPAGDTVYRVTVSNTEGKSEIQVLNNQGNTENSVISQRILQLIGDELR